MKVVQINVVCNGSTGKIMCDIAKTANKEEIDSYCFYGRGKENANVKCIRIGNNIGVCFHVLLARLGFNGRFSYFATRSLIRKLKKLEPDVIHLHNVHGYYVNLKLLFNYLKNEYKGKIIWTLHDCWSFTGHCSYFTMSKCKKWQKGCFDCPQLSCYPKEYFDTSKSEYKLKEKLFTEINNLTIVTPSIWLKKLVKKSFMKNHNVEVINNGINLEIFKPTYDKSIYSKYNIPESKKIILGVANIWEERKGLNDFIKLANIISDDITIVLIGVDDKTKEKLPKNIIAIKRTENQIELAKLYTLADVFFNPTYEDNYPTTNLESIACGTPIVCYNTGGCPEQILNNHCGYIIKQGDYKQVIKLIDDNKIKKISEIFNENLGVENMKNEYIKLYKDIVRRD